MKRLLVILPALLLGGCMSPKLIDAAEQSKAAMREALSERDEAIKGLVITPRGFLFAQNDPAKPNSR